jgi:antitoxin component of MazEF toxin-antitoxin module
MLTKLRKVGDTREVLIPSEFIAACRIEDQVEVLLQDDQIVIRPVKRLVQRPPRAGWFPPSKVDLADDALQAQAWDGAALSGDEAWVW